MLDLELVVHRLSVDEVVPHAAHGRVGDALRHGGGVARGFGGRKLVILVRCCAERFHIPPHARIEAVGERRHRRVGRCASVAGARHDTEDETDTEPASDGVHGGRL
jgi:hypothetical protein